MRDDEKCDVGQCQLSCFTNQQCPSGQTCKNGLCADGCADHKDCPGQTVCVQGKIFFKFLIKQYRCKIIWVFYFVNLV